MNTSTVADLPVPALPVRPPLTRRTVARLLWREEWRRNREGFSHGLALWLWLFLIPGATTRLEWVLPLSVLWAGLVGARIGGHDLEHGVEPLVRTLAPPLGTRWLVRAAMVLAAGLVFYALGYAACEWRWANGLWGVVAKGPFTNDPEAGSAGFHLLEALPLICAVGLTSFAFMTRYHGVGPTILLVLLLMLAVVAVTGDPAFIVQGGLVWLTYGDKPLLVLGRYAGDTTSVVRFKMWIGLIAVVWAGMTVLVGGWRYARRAPLKTSGRSHAPRWHWLPTAVLAGLVGVWDSASALDAAREVSDVGGSVGRTMWVPCVLLVQLGLFTFWLLCATPWRPASQGCDDPPRRRREARVRHCLVVVCLGVIGWSLYTQTLPPLRTVSGTWPAPLANPTVTSTRTVAEAIGDEPGYASTFDVVVWLAYEQRPNQPLVKAEAVLDAPVRDSVTESAFTLELPRLLRTDSASSVVVNVRLDHFDGELVKIPRDQLLATRTELHWSAAPLLSPADEARRKPVTPSGTPTLEVHRYFVGPTWDTKPLVFPNTDKPKLTVGLLLIPQKRDGERRLRGWSECFGKAMLAESSPPHPPAPEFEPGGMLGMWTDPHWVANLRDLRMPFWILLTLIAARWRHWLLGWAALVSVLLLVFIVAEAAVHGELHRISDDLTLPSAQRAAARHMAWWSYFHGPLQGPILR